MSKRNKISIPRVYNADYKLYIIITTFAVLVLMFGFVFNSDLFKNLGYGAIASTIVAWLIEIGNIRTKNMELNIIRKNLYSTLVRSLYSYIQFYAVVCKVGFKDKNYNEERHTWIEWYKIFKKEIEKLVDDEKKYK